MTAEQIRQLLSVPSTLKQQAIIQLFYSSGVRLQECSRIKLTDIDSKNMRIKVVGGKGNKDRYTLLSSFALTTLRQYFLKHRPVTYLFEGTKKGTATQQRALSAKGQRMRRKRSSTAEPVWRTPINFTAMKRTNTRGLAAANKCLIMAATCYNLKKWMKHKLRYSNQNL